MASPGSQDLTGGVVRDDTSPLGSRAGLGDSREKTGPRTLGGPRIGAGHVPRRNSPLNVSFWRTLWDQERGVTVLEVVLAVFIAGTVVVGSVVLIGTVVRTAGSSTGSLDLQQLVQAQIETIQQSNFIKHPPPTLDASSTYPPLVGDVGKVEVTSSDKGVKVSFSLIDPLADPLDAETGTTISFLVSDSGTN